MKKFIALSLILVTALTACSVPRQADKAEPTQTLVPVMVKEWSGVSNKATEPFVIDSNAWVISWVFQPEVPMLGNLFSIEIFKPDNSLYYKLPVNIANADEPIADSSYVYNKDTFYLNIDCMSGNWSIQVFEFK